eukprot:Gb_03528 [translate_table: standard]
MFILRQKRYVLTY